MATNEQWRSTTGLRTALTWLLAATIPATVVSGLALLHQSNVVNDVNRRAGALHTANHLLGAAALVLAAIVVATTVVFIVWTWRSAKNNELLGRVQPRHTTGWAIGGWFIPIGNLWIPVQIVQDLWRGSDPDAQQRRGSALVGWWWGFFLAGRVLTFTPVGVLCSVPAAVLAILVVRQVTDRQEALRHSSRPSGWYADPMGRFDHRFWNGSAWTAHASQAGTLTVDPLD